MTYEPIKLTDLLDGPTEVTWIMEPFIPPTSTVLLAGRSGVGKTWLSLDIALSIVSGIPWLGQFPVQQGPVLIVDEENSELLLRIRLLQLLHSYALSPRDLPLYTLIGKMINLSPTKLAGGFNESYDGLLKAIYQVEPVLVIFDSLTRCHRANENSANEMAAMFANVKHLIDETGTSCLFNHHFRKGGGGSNRSGDRIRGSTDIRAFCDVTLLMDSNDNGVTVTHDKSRWSEPIPSFAVDFQSDDDAFALSYAGEASKKEDKQQQAWEWLQEALDDGPLGRKQLIDQRKGVCSIRALDDTLKWRWENGFLEKEREGHHVVYSLTD